MLNYSDVQMIYYRNTGTTRYFQRPYYSNLLYTDGVMDFQESLEAYWLVDTVISYMPTILECFNKTEDGFFVVEILIDKNNQGKIEIYREGINQNGDYDEHIVVISQEIPFVDLPIAKNMSITSYKMYLQLGNYTPLQFVLMLPTEYWPEYDFLEKLSRLLLSNLSKTKRPNDQF